MKVILTQNVDKLGDSHEVVDVAEGYARNFLLPRRFAISATKKSLANIEHMQKLEARRQERLREAAQDIATRLEASPLSIDAQTGEAGRLFGSVNAADIAECIQASLDIEITRQQIDLEDSIRSAGEYSIPIKLHTDVQAHLKVQVGQPA